MSATANCVPRSNNCSACCIAGAAVGISVVAAVQDPAKDTLPVRQLFTVRIGLRMTEATQTAMVLGQGARDAGAECDLIADATPGSAT
jgi:hypothetical protein